MIPKESLRVPQLVQYRNPAAATLATLISMLYWLIYCLAYGLILLAGVAVILGLLFPRIGWILLNYSLDQYHVERQFKDEL